ncbi:helix-turn-helix transcriptional regulator [Actinoplanes sp. NPDC049265]|uniref:helix-turn-helix transcriptional regulator n=1 Tax=Actinoplanes sp. NPDC049265 TaxID=3363902 RepID=UPI003717E2A9
MVVASTSAWPARQRELADFLRRRRDGLSPGRAGLPDDPRRRTPGLRRDEVARMANMSENYYERLERGRGPQPSATILAGLVRALRLGPDESDYLHHLVGHAAPAAPSPDDRPDAELLPVLNALDAASPAFICTEIATVVTQNELHGALFGDLAGLAGLERNLIWRWFRGPHGCPEPAAEATGRTYVADLRAVLARHHRDQAAATLVATLRANSAEFRRMWDEHRVSAPSCPTVTVADERVGLLEFACTVAVSPRSGQRLVVFRAVPGTPTTARLARLRLGSTVSG